MIVKKGGGLQPLAVEDVPTNVDVFLVTKPDKLLIHSLFIVHLNNLKVKHFNSVLMYICHVFITLKILMETFRIRAILLLNIEKYMMNKVN